MIATIESEGDGIISEAVEKGDRSPDGEELIRKIQDSFSDDLTTSDNHSEFVFGAELSDHGFCEGRGSIAWEFIVPRKAEAGPLSFECHRDVS